MKRLTMRNGEVIDADSPMTETVACDACGEQRYTWEACHRCGHKPWEDTDA